MNPSILYSSSYFEKQIETYGAQYMNGILLRWHKVANHYTKHGLFKETKTVCVNCEKIAHCLEQYYIKEKRKVRRK